MEHERERWLVRALRDVPPSRRKRLRAEILAHLDDAAEDYLRQGMDEAAANKAALDDLGDPRLTAQALRRTFPPPLAVRLREAVDATRGPLGRFLLLGLLAAIGLQTGALLGDEPGSAWSLTNIAVAVQLGLLTLALAVPLTFDDVDLAVGPLVMLGALLYRQQLGNALLTGPLPPLAPTLLVAALAGIAVGLGHGLLAVLLRLPALYVTLVGGAALTAWLAVQPLINQIALPSELRVVTLAPTVLLAAVLLPVALIVGRAAARGGPADLPPAGSREGAWLGRAAGIALLLPVIVGMAYVNLNIGAQRTFLAFSLCTIAAGMATLWAYAPFAAAPSAALVRQRRLRLLLRTSLLWLPLSLGVFLGGAGAIAPAGWWRLFSWELQWLAMLAIPIILCVVALLAVIEGVWRSPGRRWIVGRPKRTWRSAGGRLAALALSGGVAAGVGVFAAAQGMRDNTFFLNASVFVLVPLAGLIIGGLHLLRGPERLAGLLIGALVVGVHCTLPTGDNMAQNAALALLAAGLATLAWGWAAGTPLPSAAPASAPALSPAAETLHRRISLAV